MPPEKKTQERLWKQEKSEIGEIGVGPTQNQSIQQISVQTVSWEALDSLFKAFYLL